MLNGLTSTSLKNIPFGFNVKSICIYKFVLKYGNLNQVETTVICTMTSKKNADFFKAGFQLDVYTSFLL